VSAISVRYTVARKDAAEALDTAIQQLGPRKPGDESDSQHLPGGDIPSFTAFLADLKSRWPQWLPPTSREALAQNYGSLAYEVIALGQSNPALRRCLGNSYISHAEVVYAIREEMAQRMTDIVFRRTELGTGAHPGTAALDDLQELMQKELGWSAQRTAAERSAVESHLQRYHAAGTATHERGHDRASA
jgi:glycerol-3-phosphate dehydrogenase